MSDAELALGGDNVTDEIKNQIKGIIKKELKDELRAEVKYAVKDSVKKDFAENEKLLTSENTGNESSNSVSDDKAEKTDIQKKPFTIKIPAFMKTKKFAICALAGLVAIIVAIYIVLTVVIYNGWKIVNGGYKYYDHGKIAAGYQAIDGIEYIFNDENLLYEGWVSFNQAQYYQDFEHGVYKGESEINGVKYNIADDGTLTVGTVIREDGTYLYDMQGYSVTGLTLINDDYFYANEEGHIVFGWQTFNGNRYYFDLETGKMAVGESVIDGKNWFFNEKGELITGFADTTAGRRYYKSGGDFATGKMLLDGNTYWFDENGVMIKGFTTIDGKEYYFAEDTGAMFSGWMLVGDKYCYYDQDGAKVHGFYTIEDSQYYFELENGYMLTGWQNVDGADRYFDEKGAMVCGARNIQGALYLFDGNGRLVTGDGWYTTNNRKYYRLGDGKIATGFVDMDGATYHFGNDGALSIGMTKIGENQYYFYNDGTMARNTKIDKFNVDENGVMTNPFATITTGNLDAYIEVLLNTYGRDLQSIYTYCRNNFYYKYRDKADVNTMACRMINNGSGACWDYAALCYKMLKAAGYNCQIVVGKGAYYAEHNWVIVEVSPGVWRHLDPERTHMWVFLKTDAELEALDGSARGVRYQWDHSKYPAAN